MHPLSEKLKTYMMKIPVTVLLFSSLSLTVLESSAQFKLPKLPTKNNTTGISSEEAGRGIKEALTQGVTTAVLNLNKTDGFFGSEVYKMFLPPDAIKIENTLRKAGMGAQVDKAILAINRGAEDAVAYAKEILGSPAKNAAYKKGLKKGETVYHKAIKEYLAREKKK